MVVENTIMDFLNNGDLVRLLTIAGVIAGVGKAIDRRYQTRLENVKEGLEQAHEDDIKALCKQVEDKFAELLRSYRELKEDIREITFPGSGRRSRRARDDDT